MSAGTQLDDELNAIRARLTSTEQKNIGQDAALASLTSRMEVVEAAIDDSPTPPVEPPVEPPLPGLPNNEPVGLAVRLTRQWNKLGEDGWYDQQEDSQLASKYVILPDPKTGFGSVGRQRFKAGLVGGGSPAIVEHGIPGGCRKIYIRYRCMLSANWIGHGDSEVNKQIFAWSANKGTVYTTAQGRGTGKLIPEVHTQGTGETKNYAPNLVTNAEFLRDKWQWWELYLVANSAGQSNGILDFWLDGRKLGHYTNVRYNTGDAAWTPFQWSPVWGGVGETVPADQFQYIDDLYISGAP